MGLVDVAKVYEVLTDYYHQRTEIQHKALKEALGRVPTVDPIKHGRWIGKPIAGYSIVRCSVCKESFAENMGRWNYCPNCGALMDEVEE